MNVDKNLINKFLKLECTTCNLKKRRDTKNLCKNCIFVKFKRMKICGITKFLGKHHFFYFMFHPELNWIFPSIPDYDFLGNHKSTRKFNWVIHHKDKNKWNDSKNNLVLCLNTEHRYYHNLTDHPMKSLETKLKLSKITSEIQKEKVLKGVHNFVTNHPMKNPEIRLKTTKKLKETIKKGLIKPKKYTIRQKRLLEWMNSLEQGTYLINAKLASILNMNRSDELKPTIQNLINRENLGNFNFKDNGKKGGHKRWFLVKK